MPRGTILLADCLHLPGLGGKVNGLSKLVDAGLNVPAGFVVPAEENLESISGEIMDRFHNLNAERVAVRSSATGEDSENASWAGQFETILNVNEDSLLVAINKCRQSAQSGRVKAYGGKDSPATSEVSVIVQAMVDADISGVLFTANPVTDSKRESVIEAVHGLGETLVQGLAIPETVHIKNEDGQIISQAKHCQKEKLICKNGITERQALSPAEQRSPILQAAHIKQLYELAQKIGQVFGAPQDVEWCIKAGQLYVLQSRPITTLG